MEHYICPECAEEKGGKWPKGHAATFHVDVCPVCKETKSLCGTNDFLWPDKHGHYPDKIRLEDWD